MKKRRISAVFFLLAAAALPLWGCGEKGKQKYQTVSLEYFDTVTAITGYADSEAEFQEAAEKIDGLLEEYHRLFDIYNEYEGINNLKTVNDWAGTEPVKVDERIIALLSEAKGYYELTGGKVNVGMGSVLSLWQEARTEGLADPGSARLPDEAALQEAALHCDLDALALDEENHTVFFTDPDLRLDVGAVAKGWAVQRVSEMAPEGFLISVGGNVCATGPKPDGEAWKVGIQSPEDPGEYILVLPLFEGSIVSSGDYQRYYEVEGRAYHHLIDPSTLYPGEYWSQVTVICGDSGLADALSTALFLLPREEGEALLQSGNAQAYWVDKEGELAE